MLEHFPRCEREKVRFAYRDQGERRLQLDRQADLQKPGSKGKSH